MSVSERSPLTTAFLRFATRPSALAGLLALIVLTVLPPLLPDDPAAGGLWLALAATPATLGPAAAAALAAGIVGTLWGTLSILTGGIESARRLTVLPLPMAAAMAPLLFGGGTAMLVAATALACAPAVAVPAHATLRLMARRDLVIALRGAGVREDRLVSRHILPNAAGPLFAAVWGAFAPALFTVVLSGVIGSGTTYLFGTWGALLTRHSAESAVAAAVLVGAGLAAATAVGKGLAVAARVGEER
jgi:peptide/nickel transport system permease protein